jgi:hypothetical protein
MDNYESFKIKSKFLKIAEQYTNITGEPTPSGAAPGAAPGVVTPTTTAPVSPNLAKAQKDAEEAQKKAKEVQKKYAQEELNAIQNRMKELQKIVTQK